MEAAEHLTLGGYIRVSRVGGREGDSFISIPQQRDRQTAWAAAYGHRIAVFEEELDQSGARADRPKLMSLIEKVERRELDGIVVAKLDRFGRSLVDGLQLIDRIQKAGGTFVSVADGFDLTTDTGRLVLRIMLSLAEFELDRVRGNWADAKARAVARGIHPCAIPPFGYQRESKGQPLTVHPTNGPLITELFKLRADGGGYTALSDWLEGHGAITGQGRTKWSLRAVKDIVRNDVYLGIASAGELRNENAHPPLTDPVTFRRAQRPGVQFQAKDEPSPIRALLRCAGCRYNVRADRRMYADGPVWLFTCRASNGQKVSHTCGCPATLTDRGDVEQWVVDRFFAELPELSARMRQQSPDLEPLQRDVACATEAFEQWRDDARVQQQLGMDAYLSGLTSRQEALNDAIGALARAEARLSSIAIPTDVADLRARWPKLPDAERAAILQSAIRCVFVRGRSSSRAPLDQRLRLVLRDEPVDLPIRGKWDWTTTPYLFGDGLDDHFAAQLSA
jgi:DNA invertase Pin-like site-specific DNA recombinase